MNSKGCGFDKISRESLYVEIARARVVDAAYKGSSSPTWRCEGKVGLADEHLPSVRDDRPAWGDMGGSSEVG